MVVARFAGALFIVATAPSCVGTDTDDATSPSVPSTVFISDYRANAIFRYDGVTGEFGGVFAAGAAQRVDRPASVRLGPTGQLYSAGFGRGDVVRYDMHSGAMMDVFYWDTTLLEEPVELLFHGEELVVLGNDTKNIVVIDPAGTVVRSFGDPTMRAAHDFVIVDGTLYVATESHPQLGSAIQAWDLATGTLLHHFGTIDELAFAAGIAHGPDGLLYVCDFERDRVVRFDPSTGASLGVLVGESVLTEPVSLDFGPDGTLHVLDRIGLHRFDARTGADLSLLVSATDGHLVRPLGFTFVSEAALRQAPKR